MHRWECVICLTTAERSYRISSKSVPSFYGRNVGKICGIILGLSFLTQGYGRNCGRPINSGVINNADKQTIVNTHNNLRRQVAQGRESRGRPGGQPSAANMKRMVSRFLNIGILLYWIHLDGNLCLFLTYSGPTEPVLWRLYNSGDQWTLSPSIWALLGSPLKMGPIDCPETSVENYHCMPHNTSEERW